MKDRIAPLFARISALALLPVWIGAIGYCSFESLRGHCHIEAAHSDHQHSDSQADHEHDSAPGSSPEKTPHSQGFCAALKSTDLPSVSVTASPPLSEIQAAVVWTTPAIIAAPDFSGVFSRQAKRRIWVFTPEVCTSAANRSQAPPFLS